MRWTTAATSLFIIYCIEVGVFLLFAPWSLTWDRLVVSLPVPALHDLYLNPSFRGAVSGFGLVHLVWAAHDIKAWLSRRQAVVETEAHAGEAQ